MTLRFCSRCRADVDDVGGYCLLGHPFPVETSDPIADLRAQVDKAFEKVQLEVSDVFEIVPEPEPAPDEASTMPIFEELRRDHEIALEMRATSKKVYDELTFDEPVSRNDPIVAFSPSPRADWGPERGSRRSRR